MKHNNNNQFEIIYEEKNFLIINKKTGLLVHATAHNKKEINLIDLLNNDNQNEKQKYFLVHRIDKHTSGILLIAKNKLAAIKLSKLFQEKLINKEYLAILIKELPATKVKINFSLGRSKSKKLIFSRWNSKNYKPSETLGYVLEKNLSLLKIVTGRTHQIRAHLCAIKCPILNDEIYGEKIQDDSFNQYLHAYRVSFINPFTNLAFSFYWNPPQEFTNKLNELNISYSLEKEIIFK